MRLLSMRSDFIRQVTPHPRSKIFVHHPRLSATATALAVILLSLQAKAQDIARPSLGMQRAANPLASVSVPASRYNVKLGPVKMLFNAGMGVQYNSNVNVSEGNPQPDLILQPRVGAGIYWPITKLNRLRINIQVGYDYYLQNPDLGGQVLIVDPSTEFLFNLYLNVPNVKITFFDRPSVSVNPVDNATLTDATNYAMFFNTAGVDVTWDLNDVELGIGYSNMLAYSLGNNADEFNYMNRFVNQLYGDVSFLVLPYLRLGIEGSYAYTSYLQGSSPGDNALNNNDNSTLGLFVEGKVSQYLDYTGGVGWQIVDFNESNNPGNTGNSSAPYFYFTIDNTLNKYFSHRVTTGFEAAPSSQSNFVQTFYAQYAFNWMLIRDWSLGGSAFYQTGQESPGINSENFDRVGGTIGLSYQLTKHWVFNIYYGITNKSSDVSSDSYNQQTIGLNATYNF
jgi:hypothetical protein